LDEEPDETNETFKMDRQPDVASSWRAFQESGSKERMLIQSIRSGSWLRTAGPHERNVCRMCLFPRDLINPREEARAVFDRIAVLYDAARPGYPPEVLAELQACCNLGPASQVLEIGCGSGQATRLLTASGAAIQGLEPGPALADLARKNLAGSPNVRIVTTTFEAADEKPGAYDLIVSATAFHWTDPDVSFAKAATLLRPGGSLALLTNAHGSTGTHTDERVAQPIRDLHRRFAPEVGSWTFPTHEDVRARAEAGGDIAAVWSRVERKLAEPPSVTDLFEPPLVSTYPWMASYDRPGYLAMLASQSSYALMNPTRREQLLEAVGRVIDERLGGTVTKEYITVLAIARRRVAWSGAISAVNTLGDAEIKSRTRTPNRGLLL
jgi:SAM-dependent methyltransferase